MYRPNIHTLKKAACEPDLVAILKPLTEQEAIEYVLTAERRNLHVVLALSLELLDSRTPLSPENEVRGG